MTKVLSKTYDSPFHAEAQLRSVSHVTDNAGSKDCSTQTTETKDSTQTTGRYTVNIRVFPSTPLRKGSCEVFESTS